MIDSALNELINKSKNKKFEYACAAIEAIIGAQISHLSGKEVFFPLKTNVKTPFFVFITERNLTFTLKNKQKK